MYAATWQVEERKRSWVRRALILMTALTVTGAVLTAFSSSKRAAAG